MEESLTADKRKEHQEKIKQVFTEVGKVVVGQEAMINRLLTGLFTQSHILLEGVPGIAKTLDRKYAGQSTALRFPAHSIYPGPASCRPDRHDDL